MPYNDKDEYKDDARKAVRYAVSKGRLKKSYVCEECFEQCITQGHHNDYDQALTVNWLCSSCHSDVHRFNAGLYQPLITYKDIVASAKRVLA